MPGKCVRESFDCDRTFVWELPQVQSRDLQLGSPVMDILTRYFFFEKQEQGEKMITHLSIYLSSKEDL